MSAIDASFDALADVLSSLCREGSVATAEQGRDGSGRLLLLRLPRDIAGFALIGGSPREEFSSAYHAFKAIYRQRHREWDDLSLSFVACRSTEDRRDDPAFAEVEHDPLFCRKYVIRTSGDRDTLRRELLRLPFVPLPPDEHGPLRRPRSALDLLRALGLATSLTRKLVESGTRSAAGIADDLRDRTESLPAVVARAESASGMVLSAPAATTRVTRLELEGFRAYRARREFDLDASVVVLYGPNGLGKTSFFDAIDYACTGRIGRLCRNRRRTQTEFARLATHLDQTPGSGTVSLGVRSRAVGASHESWDIRRTTGNWTNAWIGDESVDRKAVLARLTHAAWPEASPRQNTFEALFRATHLFGQEDQEFLHAFRTTSVIPETFVSDMLALQDYSNGIGKTGEVSRELDARLRALSSELEAADARRAALAEALAAVVDEVGAAGERSPVLERVADLQARIAEAFPSGDPLSACAADTASDWIALAEARIEMIGRRVSTCRALRDRLTEHRASMKTLAELGIAASEAEVELDVARAEERSASDRVRQAAAQRQAASERKRRAEQRRQRLRGIVEAVRVREDAGDRRRLLERETAELDDARRDAETAIARLAEELTKVASEQAEVQGRLRTAEDLTRAAADLLDRWPEVVRKRSRLRELDRRLTEARRFARDAELRRREAAERLEERRAAREARRVTYERALSDRGRLERLLSALEQHLGGCDCPLCGSAFDSAEALRAAVKAHREETASSGVIDEYNGLVAEERGAEDALRAADAVVAAEARTLRDLEEEQAGVSDALADFEGRMAGSGHAAASPSDEGLTELCREATERLAVIRASAAEMADRSAALEQRKAADRARLDEISRRIRALESRRDESADGYADAVRRVEALCASEGIEESDASSALESGEREVEAAALDEAAAEELVAGDEELRDTARGRVREAERRREDVLTDMQHCREQAAGAERLLQDLDLRADATPREVEHLHEELDAEARTVGRLLSEVREVRDAVRARDARLTLSERRAELEQTERNCADLLSELRQLQEARDKLSSVEAVLRSERRAAVEDHIAAYGPLITILQKRLRSVYGFGGVLLDARGGEAQVKVGWRNRDVHVQPTDFFSDSQKQILMLSIFLAGSIRQNWSGFAPILLDDPVTHFDDLNAYGFVELIRGFVSTYPESQFFVSTCEERLFALMQRKFSRSGSGAVFYEFVGTGEDGPIIERRP